MEAQGGEHEGVWRGPDLFDDCGGDQSQQQRRRRPNEKTRRRKKSPAEAAAAAQAKVAAQQLGDCRKLERQRAEEHCATGQGAWRDVYWSFLREGQQGHSASPRQQRNEMSTALGHTELDAEQVDTERSWELVAGLDPARALAVSEREAATPTLPTDHRRIVALSLSLSRPDRARALVLTSIPLGMCILSEQRSTWRAHR